MKYEEDILLYDEEDGCICLYVDFSIYWMVEDDDDGSGRRW